MNKHYWIFWQKRPGKCPPLAGKDNIMTDLKEVFSDGWEGDGNEISYHSIN
jgi:hypothetical protein